MTQQEIETERLLMRRWREDDKTPFAAICADPHVMKWIGTGETRSPEQAAEAIRSFEMEWHTKGYGLFAVELKETGGLLGFTGLSTPYFLPEVLPVVEIGWRFAKQSWGRGYATEAAKTALAFGQNDIGLGTIVGIYQTGNRASQRVMEKLGMVFDRETVDPTCGRAVRVYRTK